MQILMYASIYEAIIHYVLFDEYYQNTQEVKDLLIHKVTKRIDIPHRVNGQCYRAGTVA